MKLELGTLEINRKKTAIFAALVFLLAGFFYAGFLADNNSNVIVPPVAGCPSELFLSEKDINALRAYSLASNTCFLYGIQPQLSYYRDTNEGTEYIATCLQKK